MIVFHCENCGQEIAISQEYAGRECKCSDCGAINITPHLGDTSIVSDSGIAELEGLEQVGQGQVAFQQEPEYAGFWKRFAAVFIDALILGVALFMISKFLGGITGGIPAAISFMNSMSGGIVSAIMQWLYFTLLESSSKQATLGKIALGIIVTDEYGRRISFGQANGRYWSKIISAMLLYIGFMVAGFTEKKQALHDIIAKTLVVTK